MIITCRVQQCSHTHYFCQLRSASRNLPRATHQRYKICRGRHTNATKSEDETRIEKVSKRLHIETTARHAYAFNLEIGAPRATHQRNKICRGRHSTRYVHSKEKKTVTITKTTIEDTMSMLFRIKHERFESVKSIHVAHTQSQTCARSEHDNRPVEKALDAKC